MKQANQMHTRLCPCVRACMCAVDFDTVSAGTGYKRVALTVTHTQYHATPTLRHIQLCTQSWLLPFSPHRCLGQACLCRPPQGQHHHCPQKNWLESFHHYLPVHPGFHCLFLHFHLQTGGLVSWAWSDQDHQKSLVTTETTEIRYRSLKPGMHISDRGNSNKS